jgi:dihydroorotate dehydrogenase electron transfer subunit
MPGAAADERHEHTQSLRSRTCRVVEVHRFGDFATLTVVAPVIAYLAAPGQFVMVAVPGPGFHLRRPFSLFKVDADRVALLVETRGEGSARLAKVEVGDVLEVAGPLGSAFPIAGVHAALLVGGGIGCAPLQFLADGLAATGVLVSAAFGFRDFRQARALGAFDVSRLWVATDDGSMGRRGTVVELLDDVDPAPHATVYACGPHAMLTAVQRWTQEHGLHGYASLEAHMACGSGSCHGCVVATRGGYLRVCSEGPVLPLADLVSEATT